MDGWMIGLNFLNFLITVITIVMYSIVLRHCLSFIIIHHHHHRPDNPARSFAAPSAQMIIRSTQESWEYVDLSLVAADFLGVANTTQYSVSFSQVVLLNIARLLCPCGLATRKPFVAILFICGDRLFLPDPAHLTSHDTFSVLNHEPTHTPCPRFQTHDVNIGYDSHRRV